MKLFYTLILLLVLTLKAFSQGRTVDQLPVTNVVTMADYVLLSLANGETRLVLLTNLWPVLLQAEALQGTVPDSRLSGNVVTNVLPTNATLPSIVGHMLFVPTNAASGGGGMATNLPEGLLTNNATFPVVFNSTISGNGSGLTSLNAGNLASGTVPLGRLSGITSNELDAATWLAATEVNATNLVGIVLTNNLPSSVVLTDIAGNASFAGNVTAAGFIGDGSQLTGLPTFNATNNTFYGTTTLRTNTGGNLALLTYGNFTNYGTVSASRFAINGNQTTLDGDWLNLWNTVKIGYGPGARFDVWIYGSLLMSGYPGLFLYLRAPVTVNYSVSAVNFVATNGYASLSVATIPTNSIPTYSGTATNWWLGSYNGALTAIATNITDGGFIIKQLAP